MMGNCIVDGKIDLSRVFFHGLWFFENQDYLERIVLDKILMYGEIVPRNRLPEILARTDYFQLMFSRVGNYNGLDCVSLTQKGDTYSNSNKWAVNVTDRAFPFFCAENISIIISSQIYIDGDCYGIDRFYEDYKHETHKNYFMNGEIRVKGSISKEYFLGISYYQYYTNTFIEETIKKDFLNTEIMVDLLKLTESDFLKKYFAKQIMIEELLNKYGYNLGIFDIKTGEQFPSIEEEKEIIHRFKKCIK